jgi:bacterioferritin-associated ferredoxin
VLAHVPDLADFVGGLALLVKPDGLISLEFPHLLNLIAEVQFDTIYHEHFSYFSLHAVERVLAAQRLVVVDLDRLPTHGGSLRLWVAPAAAARVPTPAVAALAAEERAAGLDGLARFAGFAATVGECRRSFRAFLADARVAGRRVAGYGAAAKGNTLLNYCGVTAADLIAVADRNPHKQGTLLPGSGVPVVAPERLLEIKPDYLLILPWNLKDEIMEQMAAIRGWGGRFVTPVPTTVVHP